MLCFSCMSLSCFLLDSKDLENLPLKSSKGKILFPEKIIIEQSFNSKIQIKKIKIRYSISDSTVVNYGYPVITYSDVVDTKYIINTSGNDFLPSGVVINYYYEITDMENNVTVTESNELEYLDDIYDWERIIGDGLEILHHGLSQDKATILHRNILERINPIKKTFLKNSDLFEIKGVLFDSRKESSEAFQYLSDTTTKQHLFGGFAYSDYNLFLVSGYNVDVIVHEVTHLILAEAMQSRKVLLPKWLNEGLAMYYQSNSNDWKGESKNFVRRTQIMTLNKMNTLPGKAYDVGLFYRKSENIVGYLVYRYGIEKIALLIENLKNKGNFDSNFYKTYGITTQELEKDWAESILSK